MTYDVLIAGGGPAGLSAALALGRGRKRVLLSDAGPRRNATAEHVQNFLSRDGTPPDELRRVAREQLAKYPNVEVRDVGVETVSSTVGGFDAVVGSERVRARRVLLCTGMIDEMLPIDGFSELWGRSVFQCPYCHGWEIRDRPWAYLARASDAAHLAHFALGLRAWTRDVVVLTNGAMDVPEDARVLLDRGGVRIEASPIAQLVARDGRLTEVALSDGRSIGCEALFAHPPQRQVELVRALGVALDEHGFVRADPMTRETSVPGVYAAGDLTTRMQAAVQAAATGMQAGAVINMALTMELAAAGAI